MLAKKEDLKKGAIVRWTAERDGQFFYKSWDCVAEIVKTNKTKKTVDILSYDDDKITKGIFIDTVMRECTLMDVYGINSFFDEMLLNVDEEINKKNRKIEDLKRKKIRIETDRKSILDKLKNTENIQSFVINLDNITEDQINKIENHTFKLDAIRDLSEYGISKYNGKAWKIMFDEKRLWGIQGDSDLDMHAYMVRYVGINGRLIKWLN